MRCSEAEELLVALDDGELSPSAHLLLTEHLERCPACARLRRDLRRTTPRPFLKPPAQVLAALDEATDPGVVWHEANRPPRPAAPGWTAWWSGDVRVSRGAVVAYGALLAATWLWTFSQLGMWPSTTQPERPVAAPVEGIEIPAVQYQPASYRPSDAENPER